MTSPTTTAPSPWTRVGDTSYPTDAWTDGRGEILIIQMRQGLLRSKDLGQTWEKPSKVGKGYLNSVLRGPDGRIVVGASDLDAVRVSGDDGATWTTVKLPGAGCIWDLCASPTHVYAVAHRRLFRCEAGSDDWAALALPFPGEPRLNTMAQAPDGTFWLGGFLPDHGNAVGLLLNSHDGAHWSTVALPPSLREVRKVASAGMHLYAAGTGWVVRTSDGGATWADVTPKALGPTSGVTALVALGDTVTLTEDYHFVHRSEDRGATWAIEHQDKQGQVALVASSTGHLVLVNQGGTYLRDEPRARAVAPAPLPRPAPAPAPRPTTPWEQRLDQALALWKATRDPAIALLVDNVSGRVPGSQALSGLTGNKLQQAWVRLASERRAANVPALLATLSAGTLAEVAERVSALGLHGDDPRVAVDLAQWLATYPYGSTGSKPLWTAIFKLLAQCADERAIAPLQGALSGGVPVTGGTMRAWLEAALPRAIDRIDAAAKRGRKPLSPAQQKEAAALEAALKAP